MARVYKIGDRTFSDFVDYKLAVNPNPTPERLRDWEETQALYDLEDALLAQAGQTEADEDLDPEVLGADDIEDGDDATSTPH